ncbi:MAG: HAD-IB family phosphatase [Polyangiaceae bacterium]
MRDIGVETLLGELDAALASMGAGAPPLLAFDADGTLWRGDVGDDFFEALVASKDIRSPAAEAVLREAHAAGLDAADPASAASAILEAFHRHAYDEERFYELVGWLGAGRSPTELDEAIDAMQRERGLDERIHSEVRPVLAWAEARGVERFVVSASPRRVVQRGVARLGIDEDHVLAAEAVHDASGRMLAEARQPIPYGPGKVRALRGRVGDRPLLAAFGDNVFDIAMLQAARIPVAVRPKDRLLTRAAEIPACRRLIAEG